MHPSVFGSGVAQKLMDASLAWLENIYQNNIFVGVYSENFRAQKFYSRYGFKKVGEYGFPVGDHIDREFIMTLNPVETNDNDNLT